MVAAATTSDSRFAELRPPMSREEAIAEADRCLECGGLSASAPCVIACPAGIDVPSFVTALARDDPDSAARTIFAENLLGGTCARVCPVEMLCEGACVLVHEQRRPIEIGRLQRFAADSALERGLPLRRRAPRKPQRVAVVGAGPAGLACAGELATRGYGVTIFDERLEPGGLVRFAIAPYRQQREPLSAEAQLIAKLGVSFELGIALDTPDAVAQLELSYSAIVLAVGMGADADVRYPGDDLAGVWDSLPFIEATKTGHAPEIGRAVAVIGGGNTAIDVTREAVRLGADEVTLLYRRTQAEMPAYPHEVAEAREEGVKFEWLTIPVRFLGSERLRAVECLRMRLGDPDATGRRRPVEMPGTEFELPVDTVVKAIGQQPRIAFLESVDGLELENGRPVFDPSTGQTGNPKFFVAGDVTNGGATVVEAVREAKLAADGIDAWLREAPQ